MAGYAVLMDTDAYREFIVLNNKKINGFLYSFLFFSTSCSSVAQTEKHPLYIGAIGGYGSTTWHGLVPNKENQNLALMLSTPVKVEEAGSTWGVLAGFEATPYFAIEANYMHYAEAIVHFDSMSLFTFFHEGSEELTTQTEAISLMGKLMVAIPETKVRIFSSAGVASVHRKDIVINDWRAGPTFSAGLNYRATEQLMAEIAGNYTAGYGESQLSPVDAYFPFLYSATIHLMYRF